MIGRRKALREQLQRLGRGRDAAAGAHTSLFADRDLAEVAVHIQAERAHFPLLMDEVMGGPVGEDDNDGYVRAAQPGESQGRPLRMSGSQPIGRTAAYPACVLP